MYNKLELLETVRYYVAKNISACVVVVVVSICHCREIKIREFSRNKKLFSCRDSDKDDMTNDN